MELPPRYQKLLTMPDEELAIKRLPEPNSERADASVAQLVYDHRMMEKQDE